MAKDYVTPVVSRSFEHRTVPHPSGIVVSDAECCDVGPGFESREGMDVCKCIVPSRHGGTLNSHPAESPLLRLVIGEERWEAPDSPPGNSTSKLGWNRAKSYCHLYGTQGYGQRQAYI
ncbi:hypothetical protein TNCV_957371 [Trichonephila clavipes]|nr:hypothetical protein TNCV_957371 [Trichonephila clavipes]